MDPLERFEFSQSSLQDFVDCHRRFQFRYLQHISWPAIQAEPARENERFIQRGQRFHHLAQQYLMGVPEPRLTRMAQVDEDENLARWWQNFLDVIPAHLEGARFVEVALEAPLGRFRLVAKYDLVLIRPDGKVLIFDWKTGQRRPSRAHLMERLQTRVYPYLLAQAGAALNHGNPIPPQAIEMTYWFAEPDQAPERMEYTPERFESDGRYLLDLTEAIGALKPEAFNMAETDQPCAYCVYRSLCDRGVKASDMASENGVNYDPAEAEDLNYDLEQIGEISF